MNFKKIFQKKQKSENVDNSSAQISSDASENTFEAKASKFLENVTPLKIGFWMMAFIGGVFVIKGIFSAWKTHTEYETKVSHFHPENVAIHRKRANLPSITESAEKIYLYFSKLSEFVPVTFSPKGKNGSTFSGMADKVTVARNLYVERIQVQLKSPMSNLVFLLPFIQANLEKNHAVLTEVKYSKGGSKAGSQPTALLSIDVYGSDAVVRNKAEGEVEKGHGTENYLKKF